MIQYFDLLYNLYFQLLQYARKKRYYISRWNYIALCVESLVQLSVDDITFCVDINYISGHKGRKGTLERIECFHSRGQHLCKFIATKGSVCIRNEFNSHRIGLGHQHGRRLIVLGHQYGRRDVMWKHSIVHHSFKAILTQDTKRTSAYLLQTTIFTKNPSQSVLVHRICSNFAIIEPTKGSTSSVERFLRKLPVQQVKNTLKISSSMSLLTKGIVSYLHSPPS